MVVDRFEGEYAVIETEDGMVNVHISQLDENIREGDCVVLKDGRYTADAAETSERRTKMAQRLRRLMGEN